MRHIEIYLPFGLPQSEAPPDMLSQWEMPALAKLLSFSRCEKPSFLPVSHPHALPHEIAIAQQEALIPSSLSLDAINNIPVATRLMHSFGLTPKAGFWFVLHPAHIQVTLDKLLLCDRRQFALTESESRALFEEALPCFEERNLILQYGDAMTWFVRADAWNGMQTTTPDAATGRHIEPWLPQGDKAMDWRVLHNEVQMSWHGHDVNVTREVSGFAPVNALWLWGGGGVDPEMTPQNENPDNSVHSLFFATKTVYNNADSWLATGMKASRRAQLVIDGLSAHALAGDWYEWARAYNELETNWFVPLLQRIKEGDCDRLVLHLANDEKMLSFTLTRSAFRRFWIRPSLKRLFL